MPRIIATIEPVHRVRGQLYRRARLLLGFLQQPAIVFCSATPNERGHGMVDEIAIKVDIVDAQSRKGLSPYTETNGRNLRGRLGESFLAMRVLTTRHFSLRSGHLKRLRRTTTLVRWAFEIEVDCPEAPLLAPRLWPRTSAARAHSSAQSNDRMLDGHGQLSQEAYGGCLLGHAIRFIVRPTLIRASTA
jgi:hypothetical protein